MYNPYNVYIGYAIDLFAVVGVLLALWKGGVAERTAALIVLANVVIGELGMWFAGSSERVIHLFNDGITALALLVVTIRYGALWMGGVMLFFAAQFSLHSFYLVTNRPNDYLHALINNLDFSGITWCLIIGSTVAWRQRVRKARAAAASAAAAAATAAA